MGNPSARDNVIYEESKKENGKSLLQSGVRKHGHAKYCKIKIKMEKTVLAGFHRRQIITCMEPARRQPVWNRLFLRHLISTSLLLMSHSFIFKTTTVATFRSIRISMAYNFFCQTQHFFSFYLRTTPFTNLFDQTFVTYITGSTELGPLSSHLFLFLFVEFEKAFVVVIKICSHIQYFHRVPFSHGTPVST